MKIQSKSMVGLAVYTTTQGEKLGQVKDYVFHPEKKSILALVIAKGKPFGEELLLPIASMNSMGHGAVTVKDRSALISKEKDPEMQQYLKRMANIVGVRVMTTDGTLLGTVSAFSMNTETGSICELTLSGGFMDRLLKGNNTISVEDIDVFGTDVILAKDGTTPCSLKEVAGVPAEEPPQEARTNRVWNRSLGNLKAKTKNFKTEKSKTVFPEIPKEKEEVTEATEESKSTKTTIGFKDSIE